MAEEIKELIEKIQQEGIKAAQDKALQIEAEAKARAEEIIQKAKDESAKILSDAQKRISRMEIAANASLVQAGRDLLITLRNQLNSMLNKVISLSIRQTIDRDELSKILHSIIVEATRQDRSNIIIQVKKEEMEYLKDHFLSGLKEELKKGITLKASEEISSGFFISFDEGRSFFDFTDQALADYLSQFLKPELASLLKEGAKTESK